MLPLTIVRVACERVGSLPHVLRHISLCLLEVDAVELRDVVKCNDLELLKYLVLDPKCPLGGAFAPQSMDNALETAIVEKKMEFLRFLVTEGTADKFRSSTLGQCAAQYGNLDAMRWLVEHGHVTCYSWALEKAAQNGHLQVLKFLVGVAAHQKGEHAVNVMRLGWMAAQNGHLPVVQFLLKETKVKIDNIKTIRDSAVDEAHLRLVGWLDNECSEVPCRPTSPFDAAPMSLSDMMRYDSKLQKLGKLRDLEELKWLMQQLPDFELDPRLLMYACEEGDLAKVEWLVGTLKLPDQHGILQEALSRACGHGHMDVVRLLVQHGASHSSLSLDQTVANGHVEVVEFLRKECNVTSFKDFEKSMVNAAQNMHLEMVELFDSQYGKEYPPKALLIAALNGNVPMLKFLLSKPHDSKIYRNAMKHAFKGGQLQAAKALYEHFRANGLAESVRGDLVSLRKELQKGFDYDRNGPEALKVFHFLLCQEPISDLEGEDFSVVLNTAHQISDFVPLVQLLHERKAAGFTDRMISESARRGYFKLVRFFLEFYKDQALGAFCEAAENGHLNIVKYLLHHADQELKMPIEFVARNGHWRVVKFLHEHHAIYYSPWDARSVGSAFLQAASYGHVQVVKYLLTKYENRHELDAQEAFCRTCCGGFVNLVLWLMKHQAADIDVPLGLKAVRTAMETAEYNGLDLDRVVSLLEGHICSHQEDLNPSKRYRCVGSTD